MISGGRTLGGGEGLRGAVAVTTLCHHSSDFRQAWEDAGDILLGDVLCPVAMDRADDLELRILGDTFVDALGNLVIDEDAGEAADLEKIAAIRHLLGEIFDFAQAHGLEIDGDAIGAGLGDNAIERHDHDAGVTGFLDGAVERGRGGGIDDDGIIALEDHVLDLRRLLGGLVLGPS